MPTVKINETGQTPGAAFVAAAQRSIDVVSADGRTLSLKKPTPLARLDFAKAAGGGEINQLYLAEGMHLPYVAAIDEVSVVSPASDGELRALYARLGDEGNEAAQAGVLEHFLPVPVREAEAELKNG